LRHAAKGIIAAVTVFPNAKARFIYIADFSYGKRIPGRLV